MALKPTSSSPVKPQTLGAAQAFIARHFRAIGGRERVETADAAGRILADEVTAPASLPRFAASAMDGYAVRDADVQGPAAAVLRIIGTAKAGHPFGRAVSPGEAVRIYTGAPVPDGADRVIMQEDCRTRDDQLIISGALPAKRHIRHPGEDLESGTAILAAGTGLTAANLALLAALGVHEVPVRPRLKVALASTGDELASHKEALGFGSIYDCNGPYLRQRLRQLGCDVRELGILPDDRDVLLRRLIAVAAESDLIITSGGASAGAEDHVARLIERRGFLEFWRLKMKPGKPVGLGDIDDCPLLMLPGNPLAAAAAFKFLCEPLINRLSGRSAFEPRKLMLPLAAPVSKTSDKLELLAAQLAETADGRTAALPLTGQGSANIATLSAAEGWIMIAESERELKPGTIVPFYPA